MTEHKSCDGFAVETGKKFWNNDLRVCEIKRVATHKNEYSDTGETQTWHSTTTEGEFDTLSGSMAPYGRLVRYFSGKDAESFPAGTNYADVK